MIKLARISEKLHISKSTAHKKGHHATLNEHSCTFHIGDLRLHEQSFSLQAETNNLVGTSNINSPYVILLGRFYSIEFHLVLRDAGSVVGHFVYTGMPTFLKLLTGTVCT